MSDETANQLRAWAASGLTKNLFSGATPLCDTLAQAADHIEALQAQLADRDRALAEWADVSQRNFQRAIEAEERLAEARAGLAEVVRIVPRHVAADAARATLAKIGGGE
jgi:predicted phage tail protein